MYCLVNFPLHKIDMAGFRTKKQTKNKQQRIFVKLPLSSPQASSAVTFFFFLTQSFQPCVVVVVLAVVVVVVCLWSFHYFKNN